MEILYFLEIFNLAPVFRIGSKSELSGWAFSYFRFPFSTHTDRHTDSAPDTQTEKHTHRETHTQNYTDTYTERQRPSHTLTLKHILTCTLILSSGHSSVIQTLSHITQKKNSWDSRKVKSSVLHLKHFAYPHMCVVKYFNCNVTSTVST